MPGSIAVLAGNQDAPNLRKRVQGVMEAAKAHPKIKIVGTYYHVETPEAAAAEVLRVEKASPQIKGWAMIGGWPLYNETLLTTLDPNKVKIIAVDALPSQLAYVEKGLTPVLLAQPTYDWGHEAVRIVFEKVQQKKEPPVDDSDGALSRVVGESRYLGSPAETMGIHRRSRRVSFTALTPGSAPALVDLEYSLDRAPR